MNTTQQRMTAVFNEWARRYAANPDEFGAILDADGKLVEDYGQRCALYFEKIADDMDAKGLLPKFQDVNGYSYDVLADSYGAEYRSARETVDAGLAEASDMAIRTLATGVGRNLRTGEYVVFMTAWNAALEVAANRIEKPWGHSTPESVICKRLMGGPGASAESGGASDD